VSGGENYPSHPPILQVHNILPERELRHRESFAKITKKLKTKKTACFPESKYDRDLDVLVEDMLKKELKGFF